MSGLSLEALNDIGQRRTRLLIVLNDNEMSISPTVGAMSQYLCRIKLSRTLAGLARAPTTTPSRASRASGRRSSSGRVRLRARGRRLRPARAPLRGPRHHLRRARCPATTCVRSTRPSDAPSRDMERPVLVHVRTRKGRGYRPAEADKVGFHGAALPPMGRPLRQRATGAGRPASPATGTPRPRLPSARPAKAPSYTPRHGRTSSSRIGREDERVVAITAGMPTGHRRSPRSASAFPARTLRRGHRGAARDDAGDGPRPRRASGPFVALYSTFLQRAFDQVVHDVCQNDAPGRHRHRPCRARGRGRHQPPGHVHARRAAPAAQPRHGRAARRAAAAAAPAHRLRASRIRSRSSTRATPARPAATVEPSPVAVGQRRGAARRARHPHRRASGPSSQRGLRGRRAAARRRLVRRRSSTPASPSRSTSTCSLAQARGKRLVVTLEESALAGGFGSAVLEVLAAGRLQRRGRRDRHPAGACDARASMPQVLRIGMPGRTLRRPWLGLGSARAHRPRRRGHRRARSATAIADAGLERHVPARASARP